jgi:hypothetical protein
VATDDNNIVVSWPDTRLGSEDIFFAAIDEDPRNRPDSRR